MAFIDNQGARIYWDEQGAGEPVLLIMGLGYPSAMWYRTRPLLAAFIVTMGALVSDYERVLSFRVTRYFVALSVIIGVHANRSVSVMEFFIQHFTVLALLSSLC